MNPTTSTQKFSQWSSDRRFLCWALFFLSNVYWALHCLDDAFIHLRYAEFLSRTGVIQFNAAEPSYGTSSPLFLYILAALLKLGVSSIWTPKIVSIFFYGVLSLQIWRLGKDAAPSASTNVWLILLLLLMPMSSRWLSNGMETSLVACVALYAGRILTRDVPNTSTFTKWVAVWFIACITRPEFLALALLAIACVLAAQRTGRVRTVSAVALAMSLSLVQYILVFGHISPDTAIAKSTGFSPLIGLTQLPSVIVTTMGTLITASTLGAALTVVLLWAISHVVTQRPRSPRLFLSLTAFLGLLFMIAARGQAIQGVRYFVFIIFFMIPIVAHESGKLTAISASSVTRNISGAKSSAVVAALIFILDALLCWPVMIGRSETTLKFMQQDFSDAQGKSCVGYEVGYISYFTDCRMYDMAGLVNGREVAKLDRDQRITRLRGIEFSYVFANQDQLRKLEELKVLNRSQYDIVGTFDFPNISTWWTGQKDTHTLYKIKNGQIESISPH